MLAIPALTLPRPQPPSPPHPPVLFPNSLPFSTPCPSTQAPPIFLPLHPTFPRSAALPGSWEAPGMGLMAGERKQGELEPSLTACAPHSWLYTYSLSHRSQASSLLLSQFLPLAPSLPGSPDGPLPFV